MGSCYDLIKDFIPGLFMTVAAGTIYEGLLLMQEVTPEGKNHNILF